MARTRAQASGTPSDGGLYPKRDVVSRRLGDQLVLVNLGDNSIFELNRTGARVWELLQETNAREELVTRLHAEFEVDEAKLSAEVDSLLQALRGRGLLAATPPANG